MSATAPADDPAPPARVVSYPRRGGPTVLRLLLGGHLRELRERAGISAEDAGYAIRGSHSKISRLENGRVGFKQRDVADLLTLYGVTDDGDRESILSLARQANSPGWWHRYGDVLPSWFEAYLGLEEAASLIRVYEVHFVPGLLQTEEYARAVVALGHPEADEEEIERRVSLRMTRQQRLMGPDAPAVWAVLDETALRRTVGTPQVMREQIRHLIELSALPNITLQVVPLTATGNGAAGGPFTILRFAEPALSDVVYLEHLTSALYLDKPSDVEAYLRAINSLCVTAGQPQDTVRLLHEILATS
ncbi:Helix-turn-helix domain-containing protein [Thermomonospora echinospora]|uniref:Helix-turn-helix domain-containing protein n=1 Tax=Thermomonospora echinospora TaxID=1992 RepID=A0A1H6D5T4_9ACTN|nr:helix-turn-helix transcriptional regulator [Thermomonospora echinospora]SEG80621.1 Helix-turn-helix domain-containing protein [Thermomonospora echinospora]